MGINFDPKMNIRDSLMAISLILGVMFAGFQLADAVKANTQSAKANVNALEKLDNRISDLEAWKLRQEGYNQALAAMGVVTPATGKDGLRHENPSRR